MKKVGSNIFFFLFPLDTPIVLCFHTCDHSVTGQLLSLSLSVYACSLRSSAEMYRLITSANTYKIPDKIRVASRTCKWYFLCLLKGAFERLCLLYWTSHVGETSSQVCAGWNRHWLTCLVTGKWVDAKFYVYFPKQSGDTHECWFVLVCGTQTSAGPKKKKMRFQNKTKKHNWPTLSPACWAGLSSCTLHTNVHISTEFWSWWWRP